VRLTVAVNLSLAPAFWRGERFPHAGTVTSSPRNVIVVDDRDDTRVRQIQKSPGDSFVTGGRETLFDCQQIVATGSCLFAQPHRRNEQSIGEEIGQGLPEHGAGLLGVDAQSAQEIRFDVLTDHVSDRPLLLFCARLGSPAPFFCSINTTIHAQMMRQSDGIDRGLSDVCCTEQIEDGPINCFVDFFALQLFAHDSSPPMAEG
jgi:hypothetical protein